MLRTSIRGCRRQVIAPLQGKRGFLDLLAHRMAKPGDEVADTRKKESFNWEWLKWYEENNREFVTSSELDKLQGFLTSKDKYSRESSRPMSNINWDEWRAKIKDPTFVDELRADYVAEVDIQNSKSDFNQFFEWSTEAKTEALRKVRDAMREAGQTPHDSFDIHALTEKSFDEECAFIVQEAQNFDGQDKQRRHEMLLDYEQVEAERDLFGARGEMMNYAEHPQGAEMTEEEKAGRQTYVDKVLHEHEFHKFHKRERLAQQRDENARQIFLERYKEVIKIHGHQGMETW